MYVQTALKVEPTAYSAENKTLTLDITPQYRIVASTADKADDIQLSGDSKNAQVSKTDDYCTDCCYDGIADRLCCRWC